MIQCYKHFFLIGLPCRILTEHEMSFASTNKVRRGIPSMKELGTENVNDAVA